MDAGRLMPGAEALPMPLQVPFCDKSVVAETAQDFVLPDYQPEIRKLLRVSASLTPPGKFLGTGEAEFAGNAELCALYIGADGHLYSAPLTLPYEFKLPYEGDERFGGEQVAVDATVVPDALIVRVLAPRKLSVRVRLRARVTGRCREDISARTEGGAGQEPLQRLTRVRECAVVSCGVGEAVTVTDSFSPEMTGDTLRIIESRAQALVSEASPVDTGISCRGEVYLEVLYGFDEDETGMPQSMVRRIPFRVEVPLATDNVGNTGEACAFAACTAVNCRVEDGKILCAVTLTPTARLTGTDKVTFVGDCYSVEHETACTEQTYSYLRPLASYNGNMTHTATLPLKEAGMPEGAVAFDTDGEVSGVQARVDRGRIVLEGDGHYTTLWRQADGDMGSADYHVPWRYEISCEQTKGVPDGTALVAHMHLCMLTARVRTEGENLSLDAEWAVCAAVYLPESEKSVAVVTVGEPLSTDRACFTLCYPASDQTLWSVGKKYHVAVRALAGANAISGALDADAPGSLEGAKYLII